MQSNCVKDILRVKFLQFFLREATLPIVGADNAAAKLPTDESVSIFHIKVPWTMIPRKRPYFHLVQINKLENRNPHVKWQSRPSDRYKSFRSNSHNALITICGRESKWDPRNHPKTSLATKTYTNQVFKMKICKKKCFTPTIPDGILIRRRRRCESNAYKCETSLNNIRWLFEAFSSIKHSILWWEVPLNDISEICFWEWKLRCL